MGGIFPVIRMVKNSSISDCGKVYPVEIQVVDFSLDLPNVQNVPENRVAKTFCE